MQNVSITEAARNFSDLINRVAYRQESFSLIRGKKPVAELHPVVPARRLSELKTLLENLPPLTMQEMEDLKNDLNLIRNRN